MRQEAQKFLGYYPAPPEAVAAMARHLRPDNTQPWTMLDPCAGEGAAVKLLSELLDCKPDHVHAIELDEGRAEKLKANLPNARVLAPAFFEGCAANHGSISLIWLNPPFDAAYDGGRVEGDFLNRAVEWLRPHGILCLVCPASQVDDEWQTVPNKLKQWFHDIKVVPFPKDYRPYDEVVVFGVRNEVPETGYWDLWDKIQARPNHVYDIPTGKPPRLFKKTQPTELEFQRALQASPLRNFLTKSPKTTLPSPPLAISMGHVALLLASGHLDGVVNPPNGAKHVVRGTSRKEKYVASKTTTENEAGETSTKTVISERIELVVRTVGADGAIRSYSNTPDKETPDGDA